MNFKYKNIIQKVFSILPNGEKLNYFCQRFLTKSLPVDDQSFLNKVKTALTHLDRFDRFRRQDKERDLVYFEFGAGWDLINPIALFLTGRFKRLHCVDIRELVFPKLMEDTVKKFNRLRNRISLSFPDLIVSKFTKKNFRQILKNNFNIEYSAPLDASCTGLDSDSVDLISSTVTFEHIPRENIVEILNECYRILKPGGIFSISIDYQDHWSYFDKDISVYNFLTFSKEGWKKYSPSLNYQNRLRNRDYEEMFTKTGFEMVENKPLAPSESDLSVLDKLKLDSYFKDRYSRADLAYKGGNFSLRKNSI